MSQRHRDTSLLSCVIERFMVKHCILCYRQIQLADIQLQHLCCATERFIAFLSSVLYRQEVYCAMASLEVIISLITQLMAQCTHKIQVLILCQRDMCDQPLYCHRETWVASVLQRNMSKCFCIELLRNLQLAYILCQGITQGHLPQCRMIVQRASMYFIQRFTTVFCVLLWRDCSYQPTSSKCRYYREKQLGFAL